MMHSRLQKARLAFFWLTFVFFIANNQIKIFKQAVDKLKEIDLPEDYLEKIKV